MKSERSRSKRRVKVRVPGGKTKLVYKKRKPSKAKCSSCKAILKGMARENAAKLKRITKTKKRPERPYGGVLCSSCMRKLMVDRARSDSK